ncbi:hypothetical protein [Mobilicoccus massiliensis]|uniref:hypothetical protein n=1 Tax=Mobilicoccus massiliensis TaxID=1522310 RepID=UPI00059116AD|nr:hypothetical protein [Mobilicoccus massiliensis]
MKVVVVDTGRSRTSAHVAAWRQQLGLEEHDELALISWNHARVPLPLADHLVFGPDLLWGRREPKRAAVTGQRRVPAAAPTPSRSRMQRALDWRIRRLRRACDRYTAPVMRRIPSKFKVRGRIGNSSPWGQALRRLIGLQSDGVAMDYAIAVARSADAADLAEWADVVVPFDVRSRKAAWVLTRRTTHPAIMLDMVSAKRAVRERRP